MSYSGSYWRQIFLRVLTWVLIWVLDSREEHAKQLGRGEVNSQLKRNFPPPLH
jgi:hypothetical protein